MTYQLIQRSFRYHWSNWISFIVNSSDLKPRRNWAGAHYYNKRDAQAFILWITRKKRRLDEDK